VDTGVCAAYGRIKPPPGRFAGARGATGSHATTGTRYKGKHSLDWRWVFLRLCNGGPSRGPTRRREGEITSPREHPPRSIILSGLNHQADGVSPVHLGTIEDSLRYTGKLATLKEVGVAIQEWGRTRLKSDGPFVFRSFMQPSTSLKCKL
jgi:hypothetical protein